MALLDRQELPFGQQQGGEPTIVGISRPCVDGDHIAGVQRCIHSTVPHDDGAVQRDHAERIVRAPHEIGSARHGEQRNHSVEGHRPEVEIIRHAAVGEPVPLTIDFEFDGDVQAQQPVAVRSGDDTGTTLGLIGSEAVGRQRRDPTHVGRQSESVEALPSSPSSQPQVVISHHAQSSPLGQQVEDATSVGAAIPHVTHDKQTPTTQQRQQPHQQVESAMYVPEDRSGPFDARDVNVLTAPASWEPRVVQQAHGHLASGFGTPISPASRRAA